MARIKSFTKQKGPNLIVHLKLPRDLGRDIETAAEREGCDRPNMMRILLRRGLAFSAAERSGD
jgi:hypothetical protein